MRTFRTTVRFEPLPDPGTKKSALQSLAQAIREFVAEPLDAALAGLGAAVAVKTNVSSTPSMLWH